MIIWSSLRYFFDILKQKTLKILHICFSIALFFTLSVAQQSQPDTLTAFRINEEFVSDGIPSEIFWQTAHRIQNFTQRELSYGQPASDVKSGGGGRRFK